MSVRIIQADVLAGLAQLESDSVHCVVTSPPYWGLRDYGTGVWEGGNAGCEHREQRGGNGAASAKQVTSAGTQGYQFRETCGHCGARRIDDQLGLEPTLAEHIETLVRAFGEVRRVLRPDGVLFLNYGDVYAGHHGNKNAQIPTSSTNGWTNERSGYNENKRGNSLLGGLKPKDNCLIPERLSIALQDAGWWVRSRIVWHKPNPMPGSQKDRPTDAYELLYMLTKRARYWYDAEAIKEPEEMKPQRRLTPRSLNPDSKFHGQPAHRRPEGGTGGGTRNARNVWTIATYPMPEAHFATFPPKLVERCLLMACPEKVCTQCGAGWVREVSKTFVPQPDVSLERGVMRSEALDPSSGWGGTQRGQYAVQTLGWHPSCDCQADTRPGVVLDPFGGSGTVGLVADRMNRDAVLVELNVEYCDMARRRIEGDGGLFANVQVDDGYDADDNARKCYDVAIEAMREKHEAGLL